MSTLGTHFKLDNQNKFSNPKAVFKGEKYRITILSDILIRLEYDEAGIFFDNYTELVKNRNFPLIEFDVQEDNKFLVITTKHFRLQYLKEKPFVGSTFAPDSNLRINLLDTDKVWYFKHDEARNFGSVVIGGKYIVEIVKKLPESNIVIEVLDGYNMIISASDGEDLNNKIEFNLNGINPSEFPNLDLEESKNPIVIDPITFKTIISQTSFATSLSETRPILTGINFKLEGKSLQVIATDRY